MLDDVAEFVKRCEMCQKHGKMEKLISPELQSVPVPFEVMKQIGIDICNLPEVDGYKHLVVCIDYFSKWSMMSVYSLYKHVVGEFEKGKPTFLPFHKETDGFNCGPFAIAYAAEILHGKSPMEAIRNHLLVCLEQKTLTPFPKINYKYIFRYFDRFL